VHLVESGTGLQGIPVREVCLFSAPPPLPPLTLSLPDSLSLSQENKDTSAKREFSFSVSLLATSASSGPEKDIILRVDTHEKLTNWINVLTEAASLEYDAQEGSWVRGERIKVPQANPKSYVLRAVTAPLDDGSPEKDKHVMLLTLLSPLTRTSLFPPPPSLSRH
jgi:hypothetical protein